MKAIVLGTGPSLQPWYNQFDGTKKSDFTIGVNDILSHVSSDCLDAIAFVDGVGAFTPERWKVITQNPLKKYTWLYGPDIDGIENLKTVGVINNELMYKYDLKQQYFFGATSVFFAISVAIVKGATDIEVHGCDIVGHPKLEAKLPEIQFQFCRLLYAAADKGISITWSQESPFYPYLKHDIDNCQYFINRILA